MKLAFGVMHMRPSDFWDMSLLEWQYATEGYSDTLRGQSGQVTPLTRDELFEMEQEVYGSD